MKKIILFLVVAVFALTTAGCVATTGSTKTKCPSCGYEFEIPATN